MLPFAEIAGFDLTTPIGLALLRRFDAMLSRVADPAVRRAAIRGKTYRLPLSDRAEGLLVLPGGGLAIREGEQVLVCDATSALALTGPAEVLRPALAGADPGQVTTVLHLAEGLAAMPGWPDRAAPQSVSVLRHGAALAALLPAASGWAAAMVRWCEGGAVAWPLMPAPEEIALGASVAGEMLRPGEAPVPAAVWDAPGGDERYQLLSSGLGAHLDELLGSEVSDALRFELIGHWTDGEESIASGIADRLGTLPQLFATPWTLPAGFVRLDSWPAAAQALQAAAAPRAMLGLVPDGADPRAGRVAPLRFLQAARQALGPEAGAVLVPEGGGSGPVPLHDLRADRLLRAAPHPCAVLCPLPGSLQLLLQRAGALAGAASCPILAVAPAWGLCQEVGPT